MLNRRVGIALTFLACSASIVAAADEMFLGRSAEEWNKRFASSDGQQRVYAAWAIAQLAGQAQGDKDLISLSRLVHDSDPTVRYWGALGIESFQKSASGGKRRTDVLADILQPLLNDKSAAPRIAAAKALALVGQTDKALPILVAAMDDPQDSVRIQAVAALEKLGPAARPAVSTLEKATFDSSEYVKRISERSLTALGVETKQGDPKAKGKKAKAKAKSQP